jgi:hypothetical protein
MHAGPDSFAGDENVVDLTKRPGEPAAVKMVHEWTMDGGKAVVFQEHVDTVQVRELI